MNAESFDAVLAEMRAFVEADALVELDNVEQWADRLQAAHEREVGELRTELNARVNRQVSEGVREKLLSAKEKLTDDEWRAICGMFIEGENVADGWQERADAAVALLREVSRNGWGKSELSDLHETPLLERIDAFLAHQSNRGENND